MGGKSQCCRLRLLDKAPFNDLFFLGNMWKILGARSLTLVPSIHTLSQNEACMPPSPTVKVVTSTNNNLSIVMQGELILRLGLNPILP